MPCDDKGRKILQRHNFLLFFLDCFVDQLDILVGQFLDILFRILQIVFRKLVGLFLRFELVNCFAADVADGYLGGFDLL